MDDTTASKFNAKSPLGSEGLTPIKSQDLRQLDGAVGGFGSYGVASPDAPPMISPSLPTVPAADSGGTFRARCVVIGPDNLPLAQTVTFSTP